MSQALIALGANLAPPDSGPAATLERALAILAAHSGIGAVRRSRWYRTPAFPPGSGPDFVNAAAVLESALSPERLLAVLHQTEAELGRARLERWAPRTCDLDLLAVGDLVLPDHATQRRWMALDLGRAQSLVPPRLILPHPRLQERAFVLVPLAEIAPDWRHPVTGSSVAEMLADLPDEDRMAVVALE